MNIYDRYMSWRIERKDLTDDAREAIAELERRPDHLETVAKAGTYHGRLFSLVYFQEREADHPTSVCVVHRSGEILWLPHDFTEPE